MENVITLPTGSERNKIEALAEQIKQASVIVNQLQIDVTALGDQSQGQGNVQQLPYNYLTNPDFSQSIDPSMVGLSWHRKLNVVVDNKTGLITGKNSVKGVEFGWGLEVKPFGTSGFHTAEVWPENRGHNVKRPNEVFKLSMAVRGANISACLFNLFHLPSSDRLYDNDVPKKFSAFITAYQVPLGGAKFGIALIDANGEYVREIISRDIPRCDSVDDRPIDLWLHDITLESGRTYAFFVEATKKNSNNWESLFSVIRAGVFQNDEQKDVIPSMTGARTPSAFRATHVVKELTSTDLSHGITEKINVNAPYGIEKHVFFGLTLDYLSGHVTHHNLASENGQMNVSRSGHEFSFTGQDITDAGAKIMMYYSDTPLFINKI